VKAALERMCLPLSLDDEPADGKAGKNKSEE